MNYIRQRKQGLSAIFNFKTLVFLILDAFLISLSFFIAIIVTDGFSFEFDDMREILRHIPFAILIYWLVFVFFQMYHSLWRFASIEEVSRGLIASVVGTVLVYFVNLLMFPHGGYFVLYLLSFFFITSSTLGVRLSYRVYKTFRIYSKRVKKNSRAIIVGAGDAGHLVYDEIMRNEDLEGSVIGFLDDNAKKIGKTIHGVPILDNTDNIETIICDRNIDIVYIAIPQASQDRIRELLHEISKTTAKIKMFPPFYELLEDEKESSMKLRDVRIEDLLGRDVIKLEQK